MHGAVGREEGEQELLWVLLPILCYICMSADAWSHTMLLTESQMQCTIHR